MTLLTESEPHSSLCASLFLATLEISIVSTSLVSITNHLHIFGQSAWIITAYLLSYSGKCPKCPKHLYKISLSRLTVGIHRLFDYLGSIQRCPRQEIIRRLGYRHFRCIFWGLRRRTNGSTIVIELEQISTI